MDYTTPESFENVPINTKKLVKTKGCLKNKKYTVYLLSFEILNIKMASSHIKFGWSGTRTAETVVWSFNSELIVGLSDLYHLFSSCWLLLPECPLLDMRKFPLWASYPLSSSCNISGLCLTLRRWMSIGDCFLPPHAGYLVGQCIWSKAPSVCRKSRTKNQPSHLKNHPLSEKPTGLRWNEFREWHCSNYFKILARVCGALKQVTGCWLHWHAQDWLDWILLQLMCVFPYSIPSQISLCHRTVYT